MPLVLFGLGAFLTYANPPVILTAILAREGSWDGCRLWVIFAAIGTLALVGLCVGVFLFVLRDRRRVRLLLTYTVGVPALTVLFFALVIWPRFSRWIEWAD